MCRCGQKKTRPVVRLVPFGGHREMFAVEICAVARRFVFIEGTTPREAARLFGQSRETVLKMCRFSLWPGYTC